jgi:hypothetical protein
LVPRLEDVSAKREVQQEKLIRNLESRIGRA